MNLAMVELYVYADGIESNVEETIGNKIFRRNRYGEYNNEHYRCDTFSLIRNQETCLSRGYSRRRQKPWLSSRRNSATA